MSRHPRSRTGWSFGLAIVLVAGCGGSADDDTTGVASTLPVTTPSTTAPPTTAPPTTPPPTTAAPTTPPPTTAAPTTAPPTTTEPPPQSVRVLVTNDDGVDAPGLDAVVEALLAVERVDFEVIVVAPATEQSGQGGNTTPGQLTATDATTASGYPAKAVAGFPADAVIWALDQGGIDVIPDLVVSGANTGQNLGPLVDISGTVGAARAAATRNVPAIAVSAGFGPVVDYDAAVTALLAYLDLELAEILMREEGEPVAAVVSINAPTCGAGTIRGTVSVPLGTDLQGFDYGAAVDCTSTFENPADDVQAFFNGFIAVSSTPLQPATG